MDSFSISNTLSRESVYESCSILQAYQDDAASRLADGGQPEALSNERIRKGDLLLETYSKVGVCFDALSHHEVVTLTRTVYTCGTQNDIR